MSEEKVKISIHLIRRAYDAALTHSAATGAPVSVTVAEAAARMLLELYRTDREMELAQAVERVFYKLQKLESRQNREFVILKEMMGLGMRAYFNRTPEPGEAEHDAAILSGKVQFQRYLDALARNLHRNESILIAIPETDAMPVKSDAPRESQSENAHVESTLAQSSEQSPHGKAGAPDLPSNKNIGDPAKAHVAPPPPGIHRNGRTPDAPTLFQNAANGGLNRPPSSIDKPKQTGE